MAVKFCGVKFRHKKGEFCKKLVFDHYTVCCFHTPFLYLKDGKLKEGNAGDILINSPGEVVYHGPIDSESCFINDWAHITGDEIAQLLKKYPLPLNEAFSIKDPELIYKYITRLRIERFSCKIGCDDMVNAIVSQMIIQIYRAYTQSKIATDLYNNKIAELRQAICENPQKKWDLKEMALRCGYSVSRFSELYIAQYGRSPVNDVILQRVELAKKYLVSGQMSVATVAETCGFSSINYFSRCFKKNTGFTPSEIIKS